jgi:hypothetical protein
MDKVLLARALAAVAILVILAICCFLVDLLGCLRGMAMAPNKWGDRIAQQDTEDEWLKSN